MKNCASIGPCVWSGTLINGRTTLLPHPLSPTPGSDKVCLGTDYPFPLGEYTAASGGKEYAAGVLIDSMPWEEDRRRAVLGGNACAWLGRSYESFLR